MYFNGFLQHLNFWPVTAKFNKMAIYIRYLVENKKLSIGYLAFSNFKSWIAGLKSRIWPYLGQMAEKRVKKRQVPLFI